MDDNKDRFRYDGPSPQSAADDLTRIVQELSNLRDFLVGVAGRYVTVTDEVILRMACAEEAVHEMLADKWQECQDVLEGASETELDEADTEWMGRLIPSFFQGMTVESFRGLQAEARQPRVPTNPATLISTGQVGGSGE